MTVTDRVEPRGPRCGRPERLVVIRGQGPIHEGRRAWPDKRSRGVLGLVDPGRAGVPGRRRRPRRRARSGRDTGRRSARPTVGRARSSRSARVATVPRNAPPGPRAAPMPTRSRPCPRTPERRGPRRLPRPVTPHTPRRTTGIVTGTACPARSPTPATRSCWPTSCAPTWPRTDRCPRTPNWPRPSPCSPAPSRTPCGTAPARTTSCARCCASTTRGSSRPSPTSATACCAPRPAPSWPPLPPPARPRS